MVLLKCRAQNASNLKNSAVTTGLKKVSFHSNPKEGQCQRMFKLLYNCTHFMLKILQARLQQYVNWGLPDVQARFRKGRGTRDQIANIHWIIEKAREFQKNIYFLFIDYAKAFVWITTNMQSVSSVAQSCPILWDPMDCSMPGFPVHHQLLELTQTHVHWVSESAQ